MGFPNQDSRMGERKAPTEGFTSGQGDKGADLKRFEEPLREEDFSKMNLSREQMGGDFDKYRFELQ